MILAGAAAAGTFGTVIPIGGEAVDLALDEPRGVLYVADFTGNRVDVISLSTGTIQTTINGLNNPSSLSVSPDDHWLVVAEYGNNTAPAAQTNGLAVIDLTNNYARQFFNLGQPPLGVAFGMDGNALIVTTNSFQLYNPNTGQVQLLETISQVATNAIPQPPANFPLEFTEAAIAVSRDGSTIAGFGGGSPYLVFRYSVPTQTVTSSYYVSSPPGGPRVVSLADDGSYVTMAWWEMDANFNDVAEFLAPSGALNLGTHVIDSSRNLVYAQVPSTSGGANGSSTTTSTPVLSIMDMDNLETEEQVQVPETLAGKSVLSNDHNTMYSISTSGITILPVGKLNQYHRLAASAESVPFRGNFCNRGRLTQTFVISDPGGNKTKFSVTPNQNGVYVSPSSGTTPAVITVAVDPGAFAGQTGTVLTTLTVSSPDGSSIDLPATVRVGVSSPQPVQRGAAIDVPGTIVDIMADPARPAYYAVRQDKNEVLVFNSVNNTQTATLRTCTKPTSMAITLDQNYLMVGCDASHIMPVYDLNLLQEVGFVALPQDYVESIAVSNNAIWAYTRSGVDSTYGIDQINLQLGLGSRPTQLGVWQNSKLASSGMLSASANGANIVYAGGDGGVMIYSAVAGTWVASRGDYASLAGSAAASNYGQYIVGNHLLDSSGAPQETLQSTGGFAAGAAFVNQTAYFTTSAPVTSAGETGSNGPGTIAQVDLTSGNLISPTPIVESPLLDVTAGVGNYSTPTCTTVTSAGGAGSVETCYSTVGGVTTITTTTCAGIGSGTQSCSTQTSSAPANTTASGLGRTVAVLNDLSAILSLTTSGITVLPWSYSASIAPPGITNVVSAADGVSAPAPGGLVEILGTQMSPTNMATSEIPLSTALANSCVTVNGQPMPLIFVSPGQINAQMPSQASGNVTVQVLTPGGTSGNYNVTVPPTAPAVFLTGTAGPETNIPTIVRDENNQLVTDSNPVHPGDNLTIYLTGCGQTAPLVPDGQAAPMNPLAIAITTPAVTLGGMNLSTMFGGLTPGQVGLCQINVAVPGGTPQGLSVPLTITQGSGAQTLNVRVVN